MLKMKHLPYLTWTEVETESDSGYRNNPKMYQPFLNDMKVI